MAESLINANRARQISDYNSSSIYKILNQKITEAAFKGSYYITIKGTIPSNIVNTLISYGYYIINEDNKVYIRW